MRRALAAAALAVVAPLAGCADNPEPGSDDDGVVSFEIEISDGTVEPPPGRLSVSQGDVVRIDVVGELPAQVHVHGYDLDFEPSESGALALEFVADQQGRFEIEAHDPDLLLTQLLVE